MSMSKADAPVSQPTGHGTQEGGGDDGPDVHVPHARSSHHSGVQASVTNQTMLALDPSIFSNLAGHQARAINIVQLEFARDVAARTVQAYQSTLDVLAGPASPSGGRSFDD